MVVLESTTSSIQFHDLILQVLHEAFDHEDCSTNLIAYGITKSTFSSIPERVTHDKLKIEETLGFLGASITYFPKLIRLGKTHTGATRPLKIICDIKEVALRLFSKYEYTI